jgi:hypothetical protein
MTLALVTDDYELRSQRALERYIGALREETSRAALVRACNERGEHMAAAHHREHLTLATQRRDAAYAVWEALVRKVGP